MLPFYKTTHLGAQVGGNMGNNYVHQHRLIDLLTGQWGIDISPTPLLVHFTAMNLPMQFQMISTVSLLKFKI